MSEKEIDPMDAVTYMIAKSGEFAQAKANRIYCEEFRKSLKALIMKESMVDGHSAVNAQEREAYASARYMDHLKAYQAAVEAEEKLRWMLIAAEARIEVWRSQEASNRHIIKAAM
jgi:hypothetical protein